MSMSVSLILNRARGLCFSFARCGLLKIKRYDEIETEYNIYMCVCVYMCV